MTCQFCLHVSFVIIMTYASILTFYLILIFNLIIITRNVEIMTKEIQNDTVSISAFHVSIVIIMTSVFKF